MSNMDWTPAETFPPGEFLRDVLEQRGWTQLEFAQLIGRPTQLITEIIAGRRAITPETAMEFAAALGTSPQYWMNLEVAYQLGKVTTSTERIARAAALRERFPVREMIKRGWIRNSKSTEELEEAVFAYFGIKAVNDPLSFGHAARRNYEQDISAIQWAWLHRVRQLATALKTVRYSEQKLRAALPDLERLMTEPEEIRHVPKILAECGVRLIIVEPIPGSKIDGVCFWIDNDTTPVIGLSLKGDQIDRFWFNLWHEIEHVLRGDGKDGPVIDDFDDVSRQTEDEIERLVNDAAANRCVPSAEMDDFVARHNPMFSERSLIGFSRLVKRHPGIVAGQLQKRIDRWDIFKKHQPRVRQLITRVALTDGYGQTGPLNI